MRVKQEFDPVSSALRLALSWLLALPLFLNGCGRSEGGAAGAPDEPAGGSITVWTDSTELFMEHPALIVGAPDKFAVHLTDLTDFAPLRSGRVTMRFQPRDGGAAVVVTQEVPRAPGIYGPAPEFARPGVYDLTLIVESPQARDSISIAGLRVYASAEDAPRESADGGGISFLKEQQWKSPGFRTAFASNGTLAASFDASGTIEPAAGRYAEVSAPISGLVDAADIGASPAPGHSVARGQVLAWIRSSLGEDGSAAYAEARARLREAEDEHARARRLVEVEAAPARRLHEAGIRLDAARQALAGLGDPSENGRVAIRSPISGVVARRTITPGSRVDAGTALFTVVDPSVVWLTVNVPAAQGSRIGRRSGASFLLDGDSQWREARAMISTGSIIDPMSRTLPVIYQVPNGSGAVKVGEMARVRVRTGGSETGVVIPASAVLEEEGRPVAYVQVAGETFEKRLLRLGAQDRGRVLVIDGLKAGERVVTGAAYQVRLASLSTSVPAHGHEH
jgi:RND family efflux transporter MFP subunit